MSHMKIENNNKPHRINVQKNLICVKCLAQYLVHIEISAMVLVRLVVVVVVILDLLD